MRVKRMHTLPIGSLSPVPKNFLQNSTHSWWMFHLLGHPACPWNSFLIRINRSSMYLKQVTFLMDRQADRCTDVLTHGWTLDRLTNKGMDITMDKTMGPVVNVPFVGRDTLHAPEIHFLSRVKRSSMLVSQKGFGIYISIRIYTQWDNTGPPHFVFWGGEKKEKARQISNRERQNKLIRNLHFNTNLYTTQVHFLFRIPRRSGEHIKLFTRVAKWPNRLYF